jgi:CRP/FNR family transcriptional regulator, cyclic AMP receptor protein
MNNLCCGAPVNEQEVTAVALVDFLRRMPLFAGLNQDEIKLLAGSIRPRRYQQGESIFFEGDLGQVFYLIQAGRVRIYVQNEEGQETSVVLYGPGDLFGELAVIDGLPRSASAVALSETLVYTMDRDAFRERMRLSPQLAHNFMKALSVRLRYSTRQVGDLTLLDVPARLARKLLELAGDYGRVEAGGIRIDAPLTQSDLAGLTGATRESVNKTLAAFRRQGLICLNQGQITIVDPDRLRSRSNV